MVSTPNSDIHLPRIDPKLLTALERRFPEKSPQKGETIEDLKWRGGQCDVVQFIREQMRRQQERTI